MKSQKKRGGEQKLKRRDEQNFRFPRKSVYWLKKIEVRPMPFVTHAEC